MTVLFLGTGNVHRSLLAEAMLRAALLRDGRVDVAIHSAGVAGLPGMPAAPRAADLARADGLDLSSHRARRVQIVDLRRADLIVVMEAAHREWVRAADPAAATRCRLLGQYARAGSGLAPGEDVPDADAADPGSFRRSYEIVRACVHRLHRELPEAGHDGYARAVEQRLRLWRGATAGLSHADWALLDRWWDRGVPLWIVLESLDDLARRRRAAGDPARPLRLTHCRAAVEGRFGDHAGGRASAERGDHAGGDPAGAAAARLAEALRRARESGASPQAEALDRAACAVAAMQTPDAGCEAPATIRMRLREVEEMLVEDLVALTPVERLAAMREEAGADLSAHAARMTREAYESTLNRLIAERIRAQLGLLRLVDD